MQTTYCNTNSSDQLAQAKTLLEMILELSHAVLRRQQTYDTDDPNRSFPRIPIPTAPKDLVVLVRGDSKTPGASRNTHLLLLAAVIAAAVAVADVDDEGR